ncbi:MAG: matrixin family metalloprotease [Phycisphaerae bacterium]
MASSIFPQELERLVQGSHALDPALPRDPSAWLDLSQAYGIESDLLPCGCFAPGTPLDVMRNVYNNLVDDGTGPGPGPGPIAFNTLCRWSGGAGTPRALTWSLAPDGVFIPSITGFPAGSNQLFSRMDALFGGNRALWISKFQMIFDRWEELGGTSYTRLSVAGQDWDDGATWGSAGSTFRGDVRIGMKSLDGANGVLAFNPFPCSSFAGDMVLDRWEAWQNSFGNFLFLRNVAAHEHGHGIGLLHVCPANETKLMEPFISFNYDGPQQDDVRGQHSLYGDAFESDNSSGAANDLGVFSTGTTVIFGEEPSPTIPSGTRLSLHANGTFDWFKFTINAGQHMSVTARPIGSFYDSSEQNFNGSCGAGNFINALSIADLSVEIVDVDGSTVLVSASALPAGQAEVAEADLLSAGTYFVRVFESNNPSEVQLYRLEVSATELDPCIGIQCDDGLFCNGLETCANGLCHNGSSPCVPPGEVCDEANDICTNAPGACCLGDGTCSLFASAATCENQAGFYYGDGTDCQGPLDPPCLAAAASMTCQLATPIGFAGTSVPMEIFTDTVAGLQGYQFTVTSNLISGSGTLSIDCSQCTGGNNEPDCGVRINDTRGDFVFAGAGAAITAVSCNIQAGGSVLLGGSVDVTQPPSYLGDVSLSISADATPGTEFEVTLSPLLTETFLQDSGGGFVPFQIVSCILTVADPGDCLPPDVVAEGSKTLLITPVGAAPQALLVTGDLADPDVSCVSLFVQADHTLGPDPVFLTPTEWGVAAAHDAAIIPNATYNVQAFCSPNFSAPASATTDIFGDVNANGVTNLEDVLLIILAFQGDFTNVSLEAADINPCTPNRTANVADAQWAVLAFQNAAYSDFCAAPCP